MATTKTKKPVKAQKKKLVSHTISKMDSVVHFEMPADDMKRMSKFYNSAFGWKMTQLGEEMGNYALAQTTELGKDQFPTQPGRINGGFYPKTSDAPNPSVVIAVKDIKKAMKKIETAGGKVLGEPMEIPGYGMYVSFMDTEGNRVSLMEPFMG